MPYLIDGYNLLHAMGALGGRVGPTGLEKARRRLLGLLVGVYGAEAGQVTVVFDASGAPPGAVASEDYRGLQIRYAVGHGEADDLIEDIIRLDSAPKRLTVVSDDHRLQRAAKQRRCLAVHCADYLADLNRRRSRPTTTPPEKQDGLSPEEARQWLREFAGLADDPALKELTDPYGFGEADGGPTK